MKLAELMRDKGITDAELAKAIGCLQSTIFQWKAGGFSPKANSIVKLCNLFQCSADELLGIETFSLPLPAYQGQRLYNAITNKGVFDASSIHQIATQFRRFAGKTTSLESWFRKIAEVLYDIELANQDPNSLSYGNEAIETLESIEPEATTGKFPVVQIETIPTPIMAVSEVKPLRRLDKKRRKKAQSHRVLTG